jgi:hypothetical protein
VDWNKARDGGKRKGSDDERFTTEEVVCDLFEIPGLLGMGDWSLGNDERDALAKKVKRVVRAHKSIQKSRIVKAADKYFPLISLLVSVLLIVLPRLLMYRMEKQRNASIRIARPVPSETATRQGDEQSPTGGNGTAGNGSTGGGGTANGGSSNVRHLFRRDA